MDDNLVPLMHIGMCGRPTYGLAPRWSLVICNIAAYPLLLHSMENATSMRMTGMRNVWVSQHSLLICKSLNNFILIIIVIVLWLHVTGMVSKGMVHSLKEIRGKSHPLW